MADRFENDPAADVRAEITTEIDREATPSPSYTFTNSESAATVSGLCAADAVDLAANNQGWHLVFSPGHTGLDGFTGHATDPDQGRIQLISDDHAFVAGGLTYEDLATAISNKGGPLSLDPPPTPSLDDEDEQKRRAGRSSGGDMGNPAHAQLGANIRPEVGSGPGGLETYTTQKSADYRADPEQNISDYFRARFAEAERSANPPTLTLEAIAADPWNAVELPLPPAADKELLTAARSAAEYCADGEHHLMMEARAGRNTEHWSAALHAAGIPQPDVHEYNEDRWFQADTRLGAINEALDKIDGRGVYAEGARAPTAPPMTNAERETYLLALQNYAPDDKVYETLEAELHEQTGNAVPALPSVADSLKHLLPDEPGIPYQYPETFGQALQYVERGYTASDVARGNTVVELEAFEAGHEVDSVARLQQVNDQSTKRQNAERAAHSGDTVSPDVEASVSDYFKTRLSEAKAERETEGAESAAPDHGGDKTPGGGGGRGIF